MRINRDTLQDMAMQHARLGKLDYPGPEVLAYMRLAALLKAVEMQAFRRPGGIFDKYQAMKARHCLADCWAADGDRSVETRIRVYFMGLAGRLGFAIEAPSCGVEINAVFSDDGDAGRVGFNDVVGELEDVCRVMSVVIMRAEQLRDTMRVNRGYTVEAMEDQRAQK
jgi:hypothetical protein